MTVASVHCLPMRKSVRMDALTREPGTRDETRTRTRARLRRSGSIALCLLVAAAIVYTMWFFPSAGPGSADGKHDANQPVPVLTATATARDMPIYLDGLGTVQAFNL